MRTIFIARVLGHNGDFVTISYHKSREGADMNAKDAANGGYANFDGTESTHYSEEVILRE